MISLLLQIDVCVCVCVCVCVRERERERERKRERERGGGGWVGGEGGVTDAIPKILESLGVRITHYPFRNFPVYLKRCP